ADALGVELPAAAGQWRRERDRQEQRMEDRSSWFDRPAKPEAPPQPPARSWSDRAPRPRPLAPPAPPPRPGPQRKPAVGRNDPCPCGSGKKFKQCCLRRE